MKKIFQSKIKIITALTAFIAIVVGVYFIFSNFFITQAATETISLLRENCAGYSNCYTSMAAWEADKNRDLVVLNEQETLRIEGAWSNQDILTSTLYIDGWTTDAAHYIKIYTTGEARHKGKWSDMAYRLRQESSNDYAAPLIIMEDYVRVDGLQIDQAGTGSKGGKGIAVSSSISSGEIYISNNIIRGTDASKPLIGISIQSGNNTVKVWNNIVYDWQTGGIRFTDNDNVTAYVYNNTVYNITQYWGIALYDSSVGVTGSVVLKNNIVQNTTNKNYYVHGSSVNFDSASEYNLSDDGTAVGANAVTNTAVVFADEVNKDFHLSLSDNSARNAGKNLSFDGNLPFSTDIDNNFRAGSWDMGADEIPPNVTGWAWSENIGWISFNANNCDADSDGLSDNPAALPACPAPGTPVSPYGVDINPADGQLSGYAWSNNIGWIYFGPDDVFVAMESDAPNIGDGVIGWNKAIKGTTIGEILNPVKTVTGWAKILTLGDDGWLKFKGTSTTAVPYGVSIDINTGDFAGWAWNATSTYGVGIGWVSFASTTPIDYKVKSDFNTAPTITGLSANWSYTNACAIGAKGAFLRWTFNDPDSGASHLAYQLILTDNDDGSTSFDTGICTGFNACEGCADASKCKIDPAIACPNDGMQCQYALNSSELDYGTNYDWEVKVWDDWGAGSATTSGPSFTTYKHEFPDVGNPADYLGRVSQGEEIKFSATSSYYTTAFPNTSVACDSAACSWNWIFDVGGAPITPDVNTAFVAPTAAASSSPIVIFNTEETRDIYVSVTDVDNYTCTSTAVVEVNKALPSWIETR